MIRIVSALCAVLVLGGCNGFGVVAAGPYQSAAATTGGDSGIGGTGFTDAPVDMDEGVGGTGISFGFARSGAGNGGPGGDEGVGGTGIYGVISAFGSIVVNGVHIDYVAETPVSIDGARGTAGAFSIGQLVSVEANSVPGVFGERYQARVIDIQHAVVGPVEAVDETKRTFVVLGQTVRVSSSDRLPVAGEWVKVSGLRDVDGGIVATRIDDALSAAGALVRGVVRANEGGTLSLGGLPLSLEQTAGAGLFAGEEVLVRGRVGPRGFVLTQLTKAAVAPFGGRMRNLLIEGYVITSGAAAGSVAGHAWVLPETDAEGVSPGRSSGAGGLPVMMKGTWGEGGLRFEPSVRRSLPPLLEPLPWMLDGGAGLPGEWPDLLRQAPDLDNSEKGTSIDPTSLPRPNLLRAALGASGLPDALLNMAQPLTSDQLSTILRLGGADLSGDGPITFDPTFLQVLIDNHDRLEALSESTLSGVDLEGPDRLALGEIFQNLREFGLDAGQLQAQLNDARHHASLVNTLVRLKRRLQHVGLDPSSLSPQVLERIQILIRQNGTTGTQPVAGGVATPSQAPGTGTK